MEDIVKDYRIVCYIQEYQIVVNWKLGASWNNPLTVYV